MRHPDLAGVRLVCLDLDGTLTLGVGGPAIDGAADAVARIARRFPVRFVTNATSRPHRALAATLASQGLLTVPAHLYTPALTARRVLEARGHASGLLLADAASREDFTWFAERADGGAVLLATEAHDRTLKDLQDAFRRLRAGAPFYTLQQNRYFQKEGALWTDLGPVAAFLGYAAGREAENLGKPSPLLFDAIAEEVGVPREAIVMVGDDVEFDVAASRALGMAAVLVRTGKHRPGDEDRRRPRPSAVLASVADLPAALGL